MSFCLTIKNIKIMESLNPYYNGKYSMSKLFRQLLTLPQGS